MMGGFDVLTLFTRKDPISRALRMVLIILGTAVGARRRVGAPRRTRPLRAAHPESRGMREQQAGQPVVQWDIQGAGDPSIQGFATDMT